MKKLSSLFIFIGVLVLSSCDVPKASGGVSDGGNTSSSDFKCALTNESILTNECETDFLCTYKLTKNSDLKIESNQGVINSINQMEGNKWVFKIEREYDDNPNIADDEFKETIQFTIPPCDNRFYFGGAQFQDLKAIYGSEAFTRDRGYYAMTDGCVEGQKQADGKWLVQMQFTTKTRINRAINKSMRIIFD